MQILANALPGFRDLRGPAIAGYLWLLFAWLLVDPDLTRRPHGALNGAVYDAGHRLGHIGILIALSIAAYFVGSASQALADSLRSSWRPVMAGWRRIVFRRFEIGPGEFQLSAAPPAELKEPTAADQFRHPGKAPGEELVLSMGLDLAEELLGLLAHMAERATEEEDNAFFALVRLDRDLRRRSEKCLYEASKDLARPAILLVGKEPELFAEVDRLRAESELRAAAIPPALALVTLSAVRGSPWWLAAVVPLFLLLTQAVQKDDASRTTILEAVEHEPSKIKSIGEFSQWLEKAASQLQELRGQYPVLQEGRDGT